jgi:hypothetical protein
MGVIKDKNKSEILAGGVSSRRFLTRSESKGFFFGKVPYVIKKKKRSKYKTSPYMDSPPLPVPVGSPPCTIKSYSKK